MIIVRSVKKNLLGQKFGPSGTYPSMVKFYEDLGLKAHNGWDWSANDGDDIRWDCTDCEGIVDSLTTDPAGGLGVAVRSHDLDGDFIHLYWHLKSFKCQPGDILSSGDLIGLADNTGLSKGTHLHRGLKRIAKDSNGVWRTINHDNGYFGAIDIAPFFTANVYIKDYNDNLKGQISILTKIIELFKQLISKK